MNPLHLTALIAPLLIHLGQATVFGIGIMALILAVPFLTARFRHLLGWIGLAKFALPLVLMGMVLPTGTPSALSGAWLTPLLIAGNPAAGSLDHSWESLGMKIAVLIWLAGMMGWFALTIIRSFRFARQLRAGSVPFAAELEHQLAALAGTAGVDPARVSGWVSPAQTGPGVAGLFRSRIHVPRELLHTLNRDEIEAVLLHELVHVARRDNLWRLMQAVIVGVFWFHPLVWWLHRRLILESERACDERVVSLTRNGESYAQGMVKAARYALGLNVPGFSGMARSGLTVRLKALLNPTSKKDHIMLRIFITLFVLAGFALTSSTVKARGSGMEANIYDSSQLDTAPKPVTQARPGYPVKLWNAKIGGEATVAFVVDESGNVIDAHAVSATHPEFGVSAVTAVSQWKFKPGMKDGRAVNTRMSVPITYTINRN